MYRRQEDIRVRNVEHLKDGDGTLTFYDWLLPEDAPGHGKVFSKLVIPKGCSIGYHEHDGEFETYYVLSGEALVNDNGKELILHPGDMHMCPSGSGHGVRNEQEEDLVMMIMIMHDLSV
ncbi:MAG: cupin domain-containing protein [Eubacterium sp.]|nr:cupin domain-containing protein [Eubacterium sp.]